MSEKLSSGLLFFLFLTRVLPGDLHNDPAVYFRHVALFIVKVQPNALPAHLVLEPENVGALKRKVFLYV